jgi:hypothetical protein
MPDGAFFVAKRSQECYIPVRDLDQPARTWFTSGLISDSNGNRMALSAIDNALRPTGAD